MASYVVVGAALLATGTLCSSAVPPAPPPREVGFAQSFTGRVVLVDREEITLHGFALEGSGYSQEIRHDSERKCVSIITGDRVLVSGTCGSFAATKIVWTPGESAEITRSDGKTISVRRADQPLRTFRFNDQLRAGGYSEDDLIGFSYRVQDIHVGDEVSLLFQKDRELPRLCEAIMILRRPGGLVPCANRQRESDRYQHHHRMQAQQDWEEWGIPPPLHYRWATFR